MYNTTPKNGYLKINEYDVDLYTDISYQAIEMSFYGIMRITPLLPKNYITRIGHSKIIIAKTNYDDNIINKLFRYRGTCTVASCSIIDKEFNKYSISLDRSIIQTWNNLKGYAIKYGSGYHTGGQSSDVKQAWAYLTRNWEDMSFDVNNKRLSFIHFNPERIIGTTKHTITTEIRKK